MIKVKNIHGTSKERYSTPPHGYSSWIDYWKKKSGFYFPDYCTCEDCLNKAEVGAHVIKVNSDNRKWYIVPLCSSCNHKETSFNVDEDFLVPVSDGDTSEYSTVPKIW